MLSLVFNACHVSNRLVSLVNEAKDVLALAKYESTYGSLHLLLGETFKSAPTSVSPHGSLQEVNIIWQGNRPWTLKMCCEDLPQFLAPSETNAGCLKRQARPEAHDSLKANDHHAADRQTQGWHSVVTTVVPSERVFNYILAYTMR